MFDRDFWLDWQNWRVPPEYAQKVLDQGVESAGWYGIWRHNIECNLTFDGWRDTLKPVTDLYGKYGGPVFVCGAGPSLVQNIPNLVKAVKEKGWPVIAVDRALIELKAAGIDPILTVSCDAQRKVRQFYDGVYEPCDKVALSLVCDPDLLDIVLPGDVYWFGALHPLCGFYRIVYKKHGREIAMVRTGTVVTFSAVDIALWMGFDPIMTIGNELSFGTREEADKYMGDNHEELQRHEQTQRLMIKSFADAAGDFTIFPYLHPDIGWVDLSEGLLEYSGWQPGYFEN